MNIPRSQASVEYMASVATSLENGSKALAFGRSAVNPAKRPSPGALLFSDQADSPAPISGSGTPKQQPAFLTECDTHEPLVIRNSGDGQDILDADGNIAANIVIVAGDLYRNENRSLGAPVNITNPTEFFSWDTVPHFLKTKKQLLKNFRRLKKDASAKGTITSIFDHARGRLHGVDAFSPDECEQIRKQLRTNGYSTDLGRLDAAGQLAVCNLYDIRDTEEITEFKETEAQTLLEYWLFDGSHDDHYITELPGIEGVRERERRTWKNEYSTPDLRQHLEGKRYFGPKRGKSTHLITVESDRHSGAVCGDAHIAKVLRMGDILVQYFPEYRFAPEITPKNGSVKFFGWLPWQVNIVKAKEIGEQIKRVLETEMPDHDWSKVEIFPLSSPQVFAPLRADKVTVIANGPVKKITRWHGNRKNRQYYEAFSVADYVNWVCFSEQPFCRATFETLVREAVARCPDKPAGSSDSLPKNAKATRATPRKSSGAGIGDTGSWKNATASKLVAFWTQADIPPNDTIDVFLTITLRLLKFEGMSRDDAETWVKDRLEAFENTEFSDRLTDKPEVLFRVLAYKLDAIWDNNGYQPDSASSDRKLALTVQTWAKKGFRLSDPGTWNRAEYCQLRLVWTPALHDLRHDIQDVANCSAEQAKDLVELILGFVHKKGELAYSMIGKLMEQLGIFGKGHGKQQDVLAVLLAHHAIHKTHNHFHDKATGYRHGSFYLVDRRISFEGDGIAAVLTGTHTVSIGNLPIDYDPLFLNEEDVLDFVTETRRLEADRLFRERHKEVKREIRLAA